MRFAFYGDKNKEALAMASIGWKKEGGALSMQEGLEPCGSGADVYRDVVYLYTNILMDYPEGESVGHSCYFG